MKARLKDETKQILRNALHKKTDMLMYLLRLLQHTYNKSNAVSIRGDIIKPVVLLRCNTILMEQLKQKIVFFVFSLPDNGSLNKENTRYHPQKTLEVVSSDEKRYRVTSQKKYGIYHITPY